MGERQIIETELQLGRNVKRGVTWLLHTNGPIRNFFNLKSVATGRGGLSMLTRNYVLKPRIMGTHFENFKLDPLNKRKNKRNYYHTLVKGY